MNDLDQKALRNLYHSNQPARELFDWMAGRERDTLETSIDRICSHLKIDRNDAINLVKNLELAGCGRFIIGRRGQKTRFEWNYNCIKIGRIARGDEDYGNNPEVIRKSERPDPDDGENSVNLSEISLTIPQAKAMLARSIGVDEKNIEIILKG